MFGPVLYQAFRELKRTFDPRDLFNPGKIVDAPPLNVEPAVRARLRHARGADHVRLLGRRRDAPAAELCAGVGACRKKREGTMCPSYQATRDERDSTRGRANALRLAITGQVDLRGPHRPRRSTRCSTSASSARRARASARPTSTWPGSRPSSCTSTTAKHGLPLRNRVFGNVARIGRWGSRLAPVSNWLRAEPRRPLAQRAAARDRPPPRPPAVRPPTLRRDGSRADGRTSIDGRTGPGTRASCSSPTRSPTTTSPTSAWPRPELLGRARVVAVTLGPDRPALLRPPADLQRAARRGRGAMPGTTSPCSTSGPAAGRPIVACEPSCLLTIKDDYPALLRGDGTSKGRDRRRSLLTFEELPGIAPGRGRRPCPLTFRAGPRRILVQGHCHQRSLVGMGPLLSSWAASRGPR